MLPAEILSAIIVAGAFSPSELGVLRLVSRSLCDLASDPHLYRKVTPPRGGKLVPWLTSLPTHVSSGARWLALQRAPGWAFSNSALDVIGQCLPELSTLEVPVACSVESLSAARLPTMVASLKVVLVRTLMGLVRPLDLRYLTRLQALSVKATRANEAVVPSTLPPLRRLTLESAPGLDIRALISALVDSHVANTLEALSMCDGMVTGPWWDLLGGLPSLVELGCFVVGDDFDGRSSAADVGAALSLDGRIQVLEVGTDSADLLVAALGAASAATVVCLPSSGVEVWGKQMC